MNISDPGAGVVVNKHCSSLVPLDGENPLESSCLELRHNADLGAHHLVNRDTLSGIGCLEDGPRPSGLLGNLGHGSEQTSSALGRLDPGEVTWNLP